MIIIFSCVKPLPSKKSYKKNRREKISARKSNKKVWKKSKQKKKESKRKKAPSRKRKMKPTEEKMKEKRKATMNQSNQENRKN